MTHVTTAGYPATKTPEVYFASGRSEARRSDLKRFLQAKGIDYVRAEYGSRNGRGAFDQILFCTDDGRRTLVLEAARTSQVKALFLAVLTARHPDWCRGEGTCGDFRWRPEENELTHSHYALGEEVERITHHGF
jgi:hypothetical protein